MKKSFVQHWFFLVTFIPFSMFMLGYIGTYFFVQQQEFEVPELVGKNVQEAIVALSALHVGVSLLAEKEDSGVSQGIILNQVPVGGSKIRAYKNVLVTVSKRPQAVKAPYCIGKTLEALETLCKERLLVLKVHYIASAYPKNSCIVQYPEQDSVIVDNRLTVYISAGRDQLYVFPDFITILRADAEKFLKPLAVEAEFFEDEPAQWPVRGRYAQVVEQNPLPGTIFDGSRPMSVQFLVR